MLGGGATAMVHALQLLSETLDFQLWPWLASAGEAAHEHHAACDHGHGHGHSNSHGHAHGADNLLENGRISFLALGTCLLTMVCKEGLFHVTRRVAERFGSSVLMANAWHHRTDAMSSGFVLVGLLGRVFVHSSCDPIAGAVVAAIILRVSVGICRRAAFELLDAQLPDKTRTDLRPVLEDALRLAASGNPIWNRQGVSILGFNGRRAGPDLHLMVDLRLAGGQSAWAQVSALELSQMEAALLGKLQASGSGVQFHDVRLRLMP